MSNKNPLFVDTVQMVGKRVQVIERVSIQNQDVRQFSSLDRAALCADAEFVGSCDGRTPDDICVWHAVFVHGKHFQVGGRVRTKVGRAGVTSENDFHTDLHCLFKGFPLVFSDYLCFFYNHISDDAFALYKTLVNGYRRYPALSMFLHF